MQQDHKKQLKKHSNSNKVKARPLDIDPLRRVVSRDSLKLRRRLSFEQCNHDAKEETAHRVLGPKTFLYKPYMDIN